MDENKKKILVCVEGEKLDVKLMKHLFTIYNIAEEYEIVSYRTNIYTLYNSMFLDENPQDMDLLQVLKEHEPEDEIKSKFDQRYSDILLIFDMDPQDPQFSRIKLEEMLDFFSESTDQGRLYINYPMVEAFYHMKSIPDHSYIDRCCSLVELKNRTYKSRVNAENRNSDYNKYAIDRKECSTIILQNIEKAWGMLLSEEKAKNLFPPFDNIRCSPYNITTKLHILIDYLFSHVRFSSFENVFIPYSTNM